MKYFISIIFLSGLIILGWLHPAQAANPLDVIINEIAWMGTENSYTDEWIELYNNTDSPINLDGWVLKAADGTPEINLTGKLPVKSFYLLERTNDDTVPNISADQIYTGALKNDGENLELYDNFGNLIDSVDCSSGWFAGDNSTKQTMERINSLLMSDINNWQTSQNPGGTPKVKNSIAIELEPKPEPEPKPKATTIPQSADSGSPEAESETITSTEVQSITYPSGIVINEILPSPTGPDAEEEWIEVFNQNDFEVNLCGWQIVDTIGSTKTYTFPEGTKIGPNGFLVLSRPTTKITLNNSGDGLKLIQPDGNVLDNISYEKAPRGQSYNRAETSWAWSAILTPGSANIVPSPTLDTKATKPDKDKTEESTSWEELQEIPTQKELAAAGPQIPKSPRPLYIFLIAFGVAVASGAVILFLKKKLKLVN